MMEKEKTLCFAGHRPDKLPHDALIVCEIRRRLNSLIVEAVNSGYRYFITGLAPGVDLWAAVGVIELKEKCPGIMLIGVKPFYDHGENFIGNARDLHSYVMKNIDMTVCLSEKYAEGCYARRNYYMVDHSSLVIGLVNNRRSGAAQTVNYARRKGVPVKLIDIEDVIENAGRDVYF